ncbi:hypothetical protein DAPPUDRAFT_245794 [Daphnia pulex]|uniref:Apple domain-containing protein n=1 Tax=Daphnia pulex TaxID=6669 RepID=E9GP30_DAPPU|nr:hypothetical protein DAPPUDRAFT_245794 [Daphnia pulex]|eukprot:EFX78571.1 hypothetical protein DAPPUDRAFT_245794 [Daphnia pulex]
MQFLPDEDFVHLVHCSALIAAVSMTTVSAQWNKGDGGVIWQMNCRYVGDYIALKSSSSEQCGGVCIAQSGCTHFTHGPSPQGDGHCYMYSTTHPTEKQTILGQTDGFVVSFPVVLLVLVK